MPILLVVDRTGTVKPLATKTYEEETLYKKAGFKTPTDFALHHTFCMGSYRVHVYGKVKGKAGQENKYDFPPPIDNVLFFGSCLLVNKRETGEVADLPLKDWKAMYEKLFGGFEDLVAEDAAGESETEEERRVMTDPNTKFTKQGYVKDDFIVDDDDDDGEGDASVDDESASFDDDSEESLPRRKKPVVKKSVTKKPAAAAKPKAPARRARKDPVMVSEEPDATPELKDELAEEEYFT